MIIQISKIQILIYHFILFWFYSVTDYSKIPLFMVYIKSVKPTKFLKGKNMLKGKKVGKQIRRSEFGQTRNIIYTGF